MSTLLNRIKRNNLIKQLNLAITCYDNTSAATLINILEEVKAFPEDDEINKLYNILENIADEADLKHLNKLSETLDEDTLRELEIENITQPNRDTKSLFLSHTGALLRVYDRRSKINLEIIKNGLESWQRVFPAKVIKEIWHGMTVAEVLAAISFFKERYKEISYGKNYALYVEGEHDIKYLQTAAIYQNKNDFLARLDIQSLGGYRNLDKYYNVYKEKLSEIVPQITILLYDCDTNQENIKSGKIYKRTIPTIYTNPIREGIENLFSKEILEKAKEYKSAFIDITYATVRTERGKEIIVPEIWNINKDEKGNLCNWIIQNGSKEDFKNFDIVFRILDEIVNQV